MSETLFWTVLQISCNCTIINYPSLPKWVRNSYFRKCVRVFWGNSKCIAPRDVEHLRKHRIPSRRNLQTASRGRKAFQDPIIRRRREVFVVFYCGRTMECFFEKGNTREYHHTLVQEMFVVWKLVRDGSWQRSKKNCDKYVTLLPINFLPLLRALQNAGLLMLEGSDAYCYYSSTDFW